MVGSRFSRQGPLGVQYIVVVHPGIDPFRNDSACASAILKWGSVPKVEAPKKRF